eukprot:4996740-Amphidinium_carterae.1
MFEETYVFSSALTCGKNDILGWSPGDWLATLAHCPRNSCAEGGHSTGGSSFIANDLPGSRQGNSIHRAQ